MIKKLLHISLALLVSVGCFAQSDSTEVEEYVIEDPDYVIPFKDLSTKDKMHYSFGMGVGFGTGAYGDFFSTYYRPKLSFDVSSRLKINTGLTYMNTSLTNIPVIQDYEYKLFSGNISQYFAFVGAEYKLTDRLSVGGSVFYDFTAYNIDGGTSLDKGPSLDNLGYSGYVKYKVSENFSFEAEIRMNDRNPYLNGQNSSFSNQYTGMGTGFFGR